MEKLQSKEVHLAGFQVFLNRNLKPGDIREIIEWNRVHGEELASRFPISRAGTFSDKELREIFELMGPHYGGLTSIDDQRAIMSELLDCGVNKGRTLSIGCGLAPHEIYLASQGLITGEIVGVDTSANMLVRAREIAKKEGVNEAKFVQNYGSDIHYKKEFKQVLMIDSLHWMRSWKECVAKSAEAVDNKGSLFIVYSVHSPVIRINPMEVVQVLKDQRMTIEVRKTVPGYAGTPRTVIFAKKK